VEEKVGVIEPYKVCDLENISTLVTNLKPTDKLLADFTKMEIL
jgi:DeoR/GlpR family transcriptional regulator of sugar metabolism